MSSVISGLIGAAVATGLALLAERGRKKATRDRAGWKSLRAGWFIHVIFIGCMAFAAFWAFFLLNGGSARGDAEKQNLLAIGLLVASGLGTLYGGWSAYGRTISWKDEKIRIKNILGRERLHLLADIRQIEETASGGAYIIKFKDGSRLKFSKYMHGIPEFLRPLPPTKFRPI